MFRLALKDRGMGKESPRWGKACVHHTEFGVSKELTKARHGWTEPGKGADTEATEVQKKVHLPVPVETGKDARGRNQNRRMSMCSPVERGEACLTEGMCVLPQMRMRWSCS